MRFDVLSLFPDMFSGYLNQSLLGKAIANRWVEIQVHNLRDWARDKHQKVDDRPFGGGPGMVIKVQPVVESVEQLQQEVAPPGHLVLLTPQGRTLNQNVVQQLAAKERLILICGRYEGFDQRVVDVLRPDEVSIGDFVLNGGEVAAMAVIDAVIRWIPGVLGDQRSPSDDSFSVDGGLLECGQYTRPRDFRGYRVPDVLLSGDHQRIAEWRRSQGYARTRQRRADLLEHHSRGTCPRTEDDTFPLKKVETNDEPGTIASS